MYEFIETAKGWLVVWGPLPEKEMAPAGRDVPASLPRAVPALPVPVRAESSLSMSC
jgi:hypothetical protein